MVDDFLERKVRDGGLNNFKPHDKEEPTRFLNISLPYDFGFL